MHSSEPSTVAQLCRSALLFLAIVMPAGSALPAGAAGAPPVFGKPYLPTDAAQVLQAVPGTSDPAVREMKILRAAFDRNPAEFPAALALARAYVSFGQQVGDAHYAGYAEAVIAPWIAAARPPVDALVIQATILQYRHQFREARALLRAAIKGDSRNAQAWLTLATLDMVQGEYKSAAIECARVAGAAGFGLGIACSASLRSFLGQAQQSIALLEQLEQSSAGESAPFKAWIEGLLAESAERLGRWTDAEVHYRQALVWAPRDNFLRVAYADLLLDRQRPREVLALLADDLQSDTAFLRIALAEHALGSRAAARDAWLMSARFEALTQRGSEFYGREQVRFALDIQRDPRTALALAERNWQAQRAPWDARVLLEAAEAARDPGAASEVLKFVADTHLEDPVIATLAARLRSGAATKGAGAR